MYASSDSLGRGDVWNDVLRDSFGLLEMGIGGEDELVEAHAPVGR